MECGLEIEEIYLHKCAFLAEQKGNFILPYLLNGNTKKLLDFQPCPYKTKQYKSVIIRNHT